MKNRYLLVLPLAAGMMVPAVAQSAAQQNSNSTATAQPQAQTTQSNDEYGALQPLQPETRQGFWGHLNPFARKKYVQNQLAPIRNRVNELDELTGKNSQMLKDVDARATEGIRQASAKANEADQHALDAGNRAQQANDTAQQASARLQTVEQVVGNLDQYQPSNQIELRLRPGQVTLSKRDKEALDQLATDLKSQKGYVVEVQGFSPGRGQAAIQSSQKMADSVVRYLVLNHEVPVYRIYELGMGNVRVQTAGSTKSASASRVEVTLLKNGVDQLAQSSGSSSSMGMPRRQGGVTGATTTNDAGQPYSNSNGAVSAPQQYR